MTHLLVTFSGSKYHDTTQRIVEDGPRLGADRVLVYDDRWLVAHPFYDTNKWIFDHPGDKNGKRGMGWYCWKPLIILDALDRFAHEGDVVLYTDADTRPIADLTPIYDVAKRDGAMFFRACGHKQRTWCKADCYLVMGQEAIDAPAGCARWVAVQKGPWKPRQLLYEWLAYCVNPTATTFDPSRLVPEDAFAWRLGPLEEHRTEQAILTNLAIKHGYKLWREADQDGEGWPEDRDVYGQLFEQVRQGSCANGEGSKFLNVDSWDSPRR